MATSTAVSSIPPPAPLKLGSEVAADWERFRGEWQNYEIAVDLDGASDKKRAAVFLACIGSAAQTVFRTFQFAEAEHRTNVEMNE